MPDDTDADADADRPPKPDALTPDRDGIPDACKAVGTWVGWTYEWREDRGYWTKVPKNPKTGGNARPNDTHTCASFDAAWDAMERYDWDGVGFVFTETNPICGVDLDNVYDPDTGEMEPWARDVLDRLDTYADFSPSHTGVHALAMGELPDGRTKTTDVPQELDIDGSHDSTEIEMHGDGKYFTMTGHALPDARSDVQERPDALVGIHTDHLQDARSGDAGAPGEQVTLDPDDLDYDDPAPADKTEPADTQDPDEVVRGLSDKALLKRAHTAENGERFRRLFQGDDSMHGGDTSAADQALCHHLAFWTRGDPGRMDRLFRESDRLRPKWDETHYADGRTYGEGTIHTAVADVDKHYDPVGGGSDGDVAAADVPTPTPNGGTATADAASSSATDAPSGAHTASGSDGGTTTDGGIGARLRATRDVWAAEDIDKGTAISRMGHAFRDEFHFAHPKETAAGVRDKLHVFDPDTGIYTPTGGTLVAERCERHIPEFCSSHVVNEIHDHIVRASYRDDDWFRSPAHRLVVANGLLDLHDATLHDYNPSEFHTTRVPVAWEPGADCPRIHEFLHDIVRPQDVPTLYRLIGHALYKEYVAPQAAMLVGDGQNGKSVFLELVEHLLGSKNVSNRSLQDIADDKFAAADLDGKLANIHPDMSDEAVRHTSMFKLLTGGDPVPAERKYESVYKFENHATLIFAANDVPRIDDDTRANWRRWMLIDFPNTFKPSDPGTVPKRVLMRELTQAEELQGLLQRAVWGLAPLLHRGEFPNARSPDQTADQMKKASDPVYAFAQACVEDADSSEWEYSDDIYSAYKAFCGDEQLSPKDKAVFFRKFNAQPGLDIQRSKKRRRACYYGVEFTSRGEGYVSGSGTGDPTDSSQTSL